MTKIIWTEFDDRSKMVRRHFVRGTLPNGCYLQMHAETDKQKTAARVTIEAALKAAARISND